MRRLIAAAGLSALLALASPGAAPGQVHVGPEVSLADDADLGLGARVLVNPAGYEGWEFGGHFDFFFPDGDVNYWEVNANGYYNVVLEELEALAPYVGAGLNLARVSVDGDGPGPGDGSGADDTDVGVNLIAGTKFPAAERFAPFAEIRFEAGGGEQVVLTGGLMF